eukprot:840201-Amorphochlora_amoeboformis.AAC.1
MSSSPSTRFDPNNLDIVGKGIKSLYLSIIKPIVKPKLSLSLREPRLKLRLRPWLRLRLTHKIRLKLRLRLRLRFRSGLVKQSEVIPNGDGNRRVDELKFPDERDPPRGYTAE